MSQCKHCERIIVSVDGIWVDPEAADDDAIWRETCDSHDTFTAEHEPVRPSPELWEAAGKDASLGVGHLWTNKWCLAYSTLNPEHCTCQRDYRRQVLAWEQRATR